jgi:hypothetical protein
VAGLTVLSAAVVGAVPALKATGGQLQGMLRQLGGGTGMRMGRTWTVLIALQVAIALALMPVAAALPLSRVLAATTGASKVPLGEILSARIALERDTPPAAQAETYEREHPTRFAARRDELLRRLEAEPGVRAVAFASAAPGGNTHRSVEIAAGPGAGASSGLVAKSLVVGPGVFELFAADRLAGRDFHPEEMTSPSTAAIVNQSFVDVVLGGGNALGQRFRYPADSDEVGSGDYDDVGRWYEVVGVVSDFPGGAGGPRDRATVYHPLRGAQMGSATVLVRLQGVAPQAFAGRLREIAAAVDPKLSLSGVATVTEYLRTLAGPERLFETGLLALIGSVLLLSAAGMHALVSLTVTQRRKEIGIRVALGARPTQVLRTVVSRALRQIALGLGVGAVLAAALIPAITNTGGRAALVVGAVTAIMAAVGLVAVLGPARRGLGVQPMEALREE